VHGKVESRNIFIVGGGLDSLGTFQFTMQYSNTPFYTNLSDVFIMTGLRKFRL